MAPASTRRGGRARPRAAAAPRRIFRSASGQRAAKMQPFGTSTRSGSPPLIVTSRSPGSSSGSISQASSATRVRVARPREQAGGRPALDDLAGIHHRDLVADLGDQAEAVRDEHDRAVERGVQILDAARRSAPRSSRRAPWSARRRSAGRARTAAPWRSSRAGACRRRAGADRRTAATAASGDADARQHRRGALAQFAGGRDRDGGCAARRPAACRA